MSNEIDYAWRGPISDVVRRAAHHARAAGCEWLHVDFESDLASFYFDFDQNGLAAPQRDAFWLGYQARTASGVSLAHTMERVSWWGPLTLLGSRLWWVERFVRSIEAQAQGTSDPPVPQDPGYYVDQAVRRLDRLECLLDPA